MIAHEQQDGSWIVGYCRLPSLAYLLDAIAKTKASIIRMEVTI